MFGYLKRVFDKLVLAERSPKKLALSFCLGNFIALSPTIPLQTPLAFLLSWLFRLNPAVTVTTLYIVNNPLTMIPIYVSNYLFGSYLFNKLLGLNLERFNPSWIDKFNSFLGRYIDMNKYFGGGELCFWCLMLGGIILPLLISIVLYPIMIRVFNRLIKQVTKEENENNCPK